MSISVGPPPQLRLPNRYKQDKELRDFYIQLDRRLLELWRRTGGGEDLISDADNQAFDIDSQILAQVDELKRSFEFENNLLKAQIEELKTRLVQADVFIRDEGFYATTVTSTYDAVNKDFINAKHRARIILPDNPGENPTTPNFL